MLVLNNNVRSLVKENFISWITKTDEENKQSIINKKLNDYDDAVQEFNKDGEEPWLIKDLKNVSVNNSEQLKEYIENFDNWKLELDDQDLIEDHEDFALDCWEVKGSYPNEIQRVKETGEQPVLAFANLSGFTDNYSILILLNENQDKILSWALQQG